MKHLNKIFVAIIVVSAFFTVHNAIAAFYPVQGITYSVAGTVVPTDSTIVLSSFKDQAGNTFTMSNFGSIGYGTLDPESNARIEDVSFTGITANGNGTISLTGVSRGLSFSSPYSASLVNTRTHLVGSHFILSNIGAFYGQQFVLVNNAQNIATLWQYSVSPTVPDPTTAMQAANKEYVDALAVTGTPKADTATGGRVQIATGLQMASSTALGSATGNPYLSITTNNATSTYGNGSTSGLKAVITQNDGHIDSNFIRQSDAMIVTGTRLNTASTTFTATTTISASNVNTNPLILNGAATQWPAANSAGLAMNNGSGVISYGGACYVGAGTNSATATTTITHNLGSIPTSFSFHGGATFTSGGSTGFTSSFGIGTSTGSNAQQSFYVGANGLNAGTAVAGQNIESYGYVLSLSGTSGSQTSGTRTTARVSAITSTTFDLAIYNPTGVAMYYTWTMCK